MDHHVNLWDSTAEIHDSNPSEQNHINSRWGIGAAFTKLVGQTIPGRNGPSSQPNSMHGAAKLQKPYGTDDNMEMDQSTGSFWNKLQDGGLEDDDEVTTASSRNLLGAGDYESDYEADDTGPWKRSQASSQIKSKHSTLLSAEPDLDEEPELLPRQSIAKTRNKKAEKLKEDYQQQANYHSNRPFDHNRDKDEEDDSHEDSSDNDASDEESMDESDLESRRDGNESDRSQGGLGAFLNMKKEAALEENLKAFMNPDPDDKSIADMSLISASITPAEQRRLLLKRMDMSLDKSVSTALNPDEAATKELRPWRQQKDLRRGSNLGALPHGTMTMLQSLYKENDDESEEEEEDLLYSIPAEFESSLDRHIPKGKNFDDMWKDGAATVCSSDMMPTFAGDDDTVVDDYSQNLIAQKVKDKLDAEDRTSLFPEMDDEINTIAQQKARDQLAALTPSSEPSFAYNSEAVLSRRTSHASKSSGSGESSERQRRRRHNEADGLKSSRRTRASTEDKSNRLRDKSDGRQRRSTLPRRDGHATREKTNGDHEEFLNDLPVQDTSTSSRRARTTVRRGEKKDDNHDDRNKDRSKRGTSRRHESELLERKSSSTHKDAKALEDTSSRRRERSHRRRSPTHRSHREGGSDRNSKEVETKRRTKSSRPDRNDEFDKDNVGDEGRRSTNKSKNNGHREEDESRRHRDKAGSRPKETTERRKQQSTARNDEKDSRDSRRRRNDSDGDIHAQSKSGVPSTKTSPKNNDILKDLKPVSVTKSRRSSQESLGSATAKHENTAFIRGVRSSNDEKNAEDPKASSVMPRKKLEGTSSTGTRSTLESTASLGFEDNDVLESSGKSRVKGFFASLVLSKKNQHSRMEDDDDNAMTSDPIKVPRRRFSGGETTKPGAGVLAAALRKSSLEQKSKNTSRSDAVETLSLLSEDLKTSTQNRWGSIVNEEEEVTNDDNAKTSKHVSRHSTKKNTSTEEQQQKLTKKKYDKEEKEEKGPKGTTRMHDNSKTSSRRQRRSTSVPPDQELPSSSRSKKSSSAVRDEERRRRTYSVPKGTTTKTTTTGRSSQTRTTKRPSDNHHPRTSRTHTVSSSSEEKRRSNGKVESTTVRTSSKTPRTEEMTTTATTNKSHMTKTKRK
jgi:hypothetical protein